MSKEKAKKIIKNLIETIEKMGNKGIVQSTTPSDVKTFSILFIFLTKFFC